MLDFQRQCRVCDALLDGNEHCEKHEIVVDGKVRVVSGVPRQKVRKTVLNEQKRLASAINVLNDKIQELILERAKLERKLKLTYE